MNFTTKSLRRLVRAASVAIVAAGCLSACDGYDLAEEQPSWLGSSIYDYLESNGNYTNVVKIIDDLGYKEVLSRTGSKTLFVADDDAFNRFYQTNPWGARSYGELTLAQKKILLYGAMINNSCQVAYLSSSQGPVEGDCMRRETSLSLYDSVPIITPAEMPDNPYWERYKDADKSLVCFKDMSTPPMIHFIESFLQNNLINNEDCKFLYNGQTRNPGDANINGILMTEQNIKCSNGFVHKMADVITALPNMAELINQNEKTQKFANLMNRFCAPYYAGDAATVEYRRLYNSDVDSVFQKCYFSERNHDDLDLSLTPDKGPVNGMLRFDPGWNQFYSTTNAGTSAHVALQENMGVMLVPSDEAIDDYWDNGGGKVLKDFYHSWENVPDKVVSKMINVNMLNSFVGSVPSKFKTVLNDANDELGINESDVESVQMACNGAVYITNKVFNPVAYISVSFPALVDESMSIFYWAIEQCGYDVYLNSQQSYYSLFIPRNGAMLEYIDPCSFGKSTTQLFRFHYDKNAQQEQNKVWASIWNYDVETGEVGDSISKASYAQIKNRLEDILNTHIVIGNVEDGNKYYQTKGGSVVSVSNAGVEGTMTVQGSAQIDNSKPLKISKIYNQAKVDEKTGKILGNGKTYIIDEEPIQTTRQSVNDILNPEIHPEFSKFHELLSQTSFLETKHVIGNDEHGCASENISLFNTFRYTVLVPTNAAIEAAQNANEIPTLKAIADAEEEGDDELVDSLKHEIEEFIKYHIVDNSFYIGQGNADGKYETSSYAIKNGEVQYRKVDVNCSNDGITFTDVMGNTRKVTNNNNLRNLMAREYQFDSGDASRANTLYTSSFAVVHQIDGVLKYK
ncbi:MAG: fasciclin domain-containing protein [Prevotellaceae bacterium]|nr:fasciclin domain-containing protein [Candidatus Minthosoma caballi]